MVTSGNDIKFFPILYLWEMENLEMETLLTRLGRLWKSGQLFEHVPELGSTVHVCEGFDLHWFEDCVWVTIALDGEAIPMRICLKVVREALFDNFLFSGKPYDKEDIMGEVLEFIEDYLE